ncbi:unnamed protein product [Fusarium venenatum]|uniref:Uncharacterized protein n=1 Tax=Fusarium venenatum TaxID=56646 RepID=A0A2L2THA9_9HYPO|nr:uncharacterized protein FVRRES_09565 [Fusarium venenatum]CEI69488.1 unnamed protein product [Fusarium venenatum]
MARRKKGVKHAMSPQPDLAITKKSRDIYLVEFPGGTLIETQPSAIHQLGTFTMPPISKPIEVSSIKIKDTGLCTSETLLSDLPIRSTAASALLALSYPPVDNFENVESAKGPKQGDRTKKTNYDLSEEHLNALSVREKLRKGIAMGFANNIAYGNATDGMIQSNFQRTPCPLSADSMTVACIMKTTARQRHMDSKLYHHWNGPAQPTEMVNHGLMVEGSEAPGPQDAKKGRTKHKKDRMPNVVAASQRLQVIAETANFNPFKPDFSFPRLTPGRAMIVEPSGAEQREGLVSWLDSACRRFGYKSLEIDSLSFRHDHKHNKLTKLELDDGLWISPNGKYSQPTKIDTEEGSITMYEANIPFGNPPSLQKWIWFKIDKPLITSQGDRMEYFGAAPTSVLTFAIPAVRIEKAKGQEQSKMGLPTRLGDFGRLKMDAYADARERQLIQEWRFSKDGIPTFTISPHPQVMAERKFPPDFLWIEAVPTREEVRAVDKTQSRELWWHHIRQQAIDDHKFWYWVQKLMGCNVCLVEATSKKGAGWVRFNPEPQQKNEGRNLMLNLGSEVRRPVARGASRLRNEV